MVHGKHDEVSIRQCLVWLLVAMVIFESSVGLRLVMTTSFIKVLSFPGSFFKGVRAEIVLFETVRRNNLRFNTYYFGFQY